MNWKEKKFMSFIKTYEGICFRTQIIEYTASDGYTYTYKLD